MENTKNQKGELGIGGWLGVIVLIFVIGGTLVYFTEMDSQKGPTVSDVSRNPENYYNQQLTLKGEIENIRSPRIFTLDEEGSATGDEVLVVSIPAVEPQGGSGASGSAQLSTLNEQDVLVNGTVRRFTLTEIQKQTGIDFDPQLVVDFENKPVLIAREVQLLPENN